MAGSSLSVRLPKAFTVNEVHDDARIGHDDGHGSHESCARACRALLLVALVTGLFISILQAATQINEMTLSFIPKILAVFVVIVAAGPWMLNLLLDYMRTLFSNLPYIIG